MRALLLGRFQPPHRGHVRAILEASRHYEQVLVGVGSSQYAHTRDNPFTLGERFDLLRAALAPARPLNVFFFPIPDLHRHALWVRHVERLLPPFDVVVTHNPLTRRLFAKAGRHIEAGPLWNRSAWTGRAIRGRIGRGEEAKDALPPPVVRAMRRIHGFQRIRDLEARPRAR